MLSCTDLFLMVINKNDSHNDCGWEWLIFVDFYWWLWHASVACINGGLEQKNFYEIFRKLMLLL